MQSLKTLPLLDQIFDGAPAPTGPPLTGEDLQDSGIESVLAHTPEDYRERFMQVIKDFPRGQLFCVEDVRHIAGEPPKEVHVNCLGALVRSAARAKLIAFTNETTTSKRAQRHAGRVVVWRRL